jgi:hypothetical protein
LPELKPGKHRFSGLFLWPGGLRKPAAWSLPVAKALKMPMVWGFLGTGFFADSARAISNVFEMP